MTDAEILDRIFAALRDHDGQVMVGGHDPERRLDEANVFIRTVRGLSGERQRGWRRMFTP